MNESIPNPDPGAITINGCQIKFPQSKKPFSSQLAVISKALVAMNSGTNALLESPTGTGKTLALLTSTLSWQIKKFQTDHEEYELNSSKELESTRSMSQQDLNDENKSKTNSYPLPTVKPKLSKPKKKTIFFCSRTHSQLQQVIDELRNCHDDYIEDLSMCILSARSHLCVNDKAKKASSQGGKTIDEVCHDLNEKGSCSYSYNPKEVYNQLINRKVWDIEDAVMIGKKHKGCPYYARFLIRMLNIS